MSYGIVTERLTKRYGKTAALDEVSFAVPEGGVYGLVGANGAGKTTMIKALTNIIRPTSGRAQVLGMDSAELKGKSLERIGYVSENQELPEWMTVGEMLAYVRPFYPQWDGELAGRLMRQFDLPLKRQLRRLSRGMRMKAAFVASMAYRPAALVLDEPFSGLDPLVRDELIEALRELSGGTTMLISSHDLAEIESFASHIGFLENGRLLFSEEMAVLKERFREVTVRLDGVWAVPGNLPEAWLKAEVAEGAVRFVHSGYRGEVSEAEVRTVFAGAPEVRFEAMPLRAIFLAIARAGREQRRGLAEDNQGSAVA
jgi:ABC-2 type transport system ATP-binding protein